MIELSASALTEKTADSFGRFTPVLLIETFLNNFIFSDTFNKPKDRFFRAFSAFG